MVKTRAANGKFQTQIQKVESCNDISEIFILPDNSKKWFFRIMVYTILILITSPWIFIMMKKNSISNLGQKVNEFYDDNFSCSSRMSLERPKEEILIKASSISL